MSNILYFGDNRFVIAEHIPPATVDLIYLDPPFNSKAQYNLLYETRGNLRESAQQTIFRDLWSWEEEEAQASYQAVLAHGGPVAALVEALTLALRRSDMMAYVAMMAARLIQMHAVLKPTGSIYLHCDPAASHYIKLILDAIFGSKNFRNEIVWKRSPFSGSSKSRAKQLPRTHDIVFFYTASDRWTWNKPTLPYTAKYLKRFKWVDGRGNYRKSLLKTYSDETLERLRAEDRLIEPVQEGANYSYKQYLKESSGTRDIDDVWTDINMINPMSNERVGYPTQKPQELLRRIIEQSSNEGDVVLDPFCGCGTSILAAQAAKRQWIGIDISYYSVRLVQRRLVANFGRDCVVPIAGIPADLSSAEALANNQPYGFQQWAVGELGCQLWNEGKKGADGGIDGEMWFYNPPHNAGRLLVQVKGGRRVGAPAVREFLTVLDREKAHLGVFFSRSEPTSEMRREIAGLADVRVGGKTYRKLQFCWLTQWFSGIRPDLPTPIALEVAGDRSATRKRASRPDPRQPQFTFLLEGEAALPRAKRGQVMNPVMIPDSALKAS